MIDFLVIIYNYQLNLLSFETYTELCLKYFPKSELPTDFCFLFTVPLLVSIKEQWRFTISEHGTFYNFGNQERRLCPNFWRPKHFS